MLESKKLLHVHEVLKPVVVDFEAFYRELSLKGVGVELPHFVMVDVQLLQLL